MIKREIYSSTPSQKLGERKTEAPHIISVRQLYYKPRPTRPSRSWIWTRHSNARIKKRNRNRRELDAEAVNSEAVEAKADAAEADAAEADADQTQSA